MEIKKKETNVWTGIYKGVNFEINNWITKGFDPYIKERESWTYYLILNLSKIPVENNPDSFWLKGIKEKNWIRYDYYNHPILSDLDWHGGITYYSKIGGFDEDHKVIKVGCDYQHYHDEYKKYNLNHIKLDVQSSIDKFLKYVPDYKYRCCGNGKFYYLNQGIVKQDKFYSKEYWLKEEWFKNEYKLLKRKENLNSVLKSK